MTRPTTCFLVFFLAVGLATHAPAQEAWSLMTADLKTEPATLKSIDAAGVHVTSSGADRVVPMDQFVELTRSLPTLPLAGRFALHLVGGDRIGGEPVAVKGEHLIWKSAAAGETEIPMRLLAGLTKPDATVTDEPRKEDVATLGNGDTVRGSIADINSTKVTLQTDAGPTDIPLESLVAVAFASAAPTGHDKPGFRLRLDDGSSLLGSAATLDGATLQLTLAGTKEGPRPIDLSRVASIEQVNGPVSWLSSRAPNQSVYIPYLQGGRDYPARMNANYAGQPIYFKDRHFLRGIGVHSYSKLVFPLDGKSYTTFRTRYAIDPDARNGTADVTVRIKLDDKVMHEREHFQAGELSPPVVLDLNGSTTLTLEVDYGANGFAEDHLNWIGSALLKVKPAAEAGEPAAGAATPNPVTSPSTPSPSIGEPLPTAPARPESGIRP